MANAATVEVFGPIDVVQAAVEALPAVVGVAVNRVGCTVVNMGDWSVTLGDEDDDVSTFVRVDGDDPDAAALVLFRLLAVLPFGVQARSAEAGDVLASRSARPAA